MRDLDQELRENIKKEMYKHGQLSILFDKTDYIIIKWGLFENIQKEHDKRFNKMKEAGLDDMANDLTIMELPRDEELVFKILACHYLEKFLKENHIKL